MASQPGTPQDNAQWGFRKKPLWIYCLSIAFILAPFFNFGLALWGAGVQRWYSPSAWWAWLPFITTDSWVISLLTMAAGVTLLYVRKSSFWFSLIVLGAVLVQSLMRWSHWAHTGPLLGIGALTITVGLMVILYFSNFRQPYLNPRIRWWETSPRYRVELAVKVQDWPHEGLLQDISKSGALIEWKNTSDIPQIEGSTLINIRENLSLPAQVARRTAQGYGLRFEKLDREEKQGLKRFLDQLRQDPAKFKR